jgi:antirestriction protein ArdC
MGRSTSTTATETESRTDIYQRVTDRIVAAIEARLAEGKAGMPWHRKSHGGTATGLPMNAASKTSYRGVNVPVLWATADAAGYGTGLWATYKQWGEMGGQVRKGEQGTPVVYWKITKPSERGDTDGEDEASGGKRGSFFVRYYNVFNLAQVDGATLPADTAPELPESERIAHAEAFIAALPGLDLRHGGGMAFYMPSQDRVQMPPFADFKDAEGYYSVLYHELVHWTGAKHRLDRDLTGRFGSAVYAADELVAELGAAFICASQALSSEPRPDHAKYIQSWLQALKNDKRAIFTAAAKAQQAADWLIAAGTKTREIAA